MCLCVCVCVCVWVWVGVGLLVLHGELLLLLSIATHIGQFGME